MSFAEHSLQFSLIFWGVYLLGQLVRAHYLKYLAARQVGQLKKSLEALVAVLPERPKAPTCPTKELLQ